MSTRSQLPEKSQQAATRTHPDKRVRQQVQTFVDALERADVDAIVSLLVQEVAAVPHAESKRGPRCNRLSARGRAATPASGRPAHPRALEAA